MCVKYFVSSLYISLVNFTVKILISSQVKKLISLQGYYIALCEHFQEKYRRLTPCALFRLFFFPW